VYAADGGTSAACPVVAGVVAAVRSKRPYDPSNAAASPATIRTLLTSTAEDLGASGYDFQHGFGVVNGCALQLRFAPPPTINLCERYPFLCGIHGWPPGIPFPRPPFPVPPLPLPRAPIPGLRMQAGQEASSSTHWSGESGAAEPSREGAEDSQTEAPDLVELSYLIGYAQGQQAGAGAQPGPRPQAVAGDVQHSKPCGCADT